MIEPEKLIEPYNQNNLLDYTKKTRNIMQNIYKNCGVKRRTSHCGAEQRTNHFTNPYF
jgi:hypothetical protein